MQDSRRIRVALTTHRPTTGRSDGRPIRDVANEHSGAPSAGQIQYVQRNSCWLSDLQRPSVGGFGVVELAAMTTATWSNRKKVDALVAQITHRATSIEIYYLGKKLMV